MTDVLFETTHLVLRRTLPSDRDTILKFYNHPLVSPWINTGNPSGNTRTEFETAALLTLTDVALLGCVIQEKTTSQFVGIAGLIPWCHSGDLKNRNVEVFIRKAVVMHTDFGCVTVFFPSPVFCLPSPMFRLPPSAVR